MTRQVIHTGQTAQMNTSSRKKRVCSGANDWPNRQIVTTIDQDNEDCNVEMLFHNRKHRHHLTNAICLEQEEYCQRLSD